MTLLARPAVACLGIDTNTKLTRAQAQALFDAGKRWVGRYVPLPGLHPGADIDREELLMLCDVGFQVSLVQHVRYPGWDPRAHHGAADGRVAAEYAALCTYPDGAHLFLDMEGVKPGVGASSVAAFCNDWATAVTHSGFRAGLYVGYDHVLRPSELYEDLSHDCYWLAPGQAGVATRGPAIRQVKLDTTISGVRVDEDELAPDLLGGMPYVAVSG